MVLYINIYIYYIVTFKRSDRDFLRIERFKKWVRTTHIHTKKNNQFIDRVNFYFLNSQSRQRLYYFLNEKK